MQKNTNKHLKKNKMYGKIIIAYNNVRKVSEGGTGSRHPLLGDVERSTHLNFL